MVPLRLEWRLTSPVAGMSLPLHLDALVAYAITEEALRYGTAIGNVRDIANELPLEKAQKGDLFCWKASALLAEHIHGHEMQMWTRKFPEQDYADLYINGKFSDVKAKVNPETNMLDLKQYAAVMDTLRGQTKNHFQFIPVRHIDRFVAYCIGDIDRLTELLSPESGYITSIGARKRQSAGNIVKTGEGFAIQEDERALEYWEKRILPWHKEGYEPIQAAHIPPYWAVENRAVSYIHGDFLI